ncbi:family 2 glycosyl transferase [Tanticharoenia sakaeratensis NBRC 103193]|uniref:Family 2 glycosyl transferase n=1 Tax=Tanticharoenia sakaeratensis NBRC 103193 TaxID=1231623 RepID=A0A0D6MM95_9PROT|nr:family 2 glycosyl transferase [Tanticharoenia sakaeratensis NBRC 103193]GBQ21536.1 glycosyltransferase [Tanticharoenia sakaeratensis NBRC 103193]
MPKDMPLNDGVAAAIAGDWATLTGTPATDTASLWEKAAAPCQTWLTRFVQDADAFRDSGNPAEAARLYQAATALAPWRIDLRLQLGNMLKDSGRLPAAEATYRAILSESPDDAETFLQLGHVYKLMGRRTKAMAAYRDALRCDGNCSAAHQELFLAGETDAQRATAAHQVMAHGTEQAAQIAGALNEMRASLDAMARMLPDISAFTAFPIEDYALFRRLFDPPAAPARPDFSLTVVIPQNDVPPAIAAVQIATLADAASVEAIITIGASAALRNAWDTPERLYGIVTHIATAEDLPETLETDAVLLLAPHRIPHPTLSGWVAAAMEIGDAEMAFCDEEIVRPSPETQRPFEPVALLPRPSADPLWLTQCDTVGDTLALTRDAWRTYRGMAPRDAVMAGLADRRTITHIPYPLTATPSHHSPSVMAGALPDRLRLRPSDACTAILCTRDNAQDCRTMVESLFRTARHPETLTCLIVDNGTSALPHLAILEELAGLPRVRVVRDERPFNWSALNNDATQLVETPNILFCNDDMEMLTDGWDVTLSALLHDELTGAVGVKLLYADDTMQHAGVLLGWKGSVIHDGLYEPRDSLAHFGRWQVTREASAVTGAFLAMRRAVFAASGGFDADRMPVAYSDIDLCLRLREQGLKVIWTPLIEVRHDESVSRGLDHLNPLRHARSMTERAAFETIWGKERLSSDPTVNPVWADATLPWRLIRPVPADVAMSSLTRRLP